MTVASCRERIVDAIAGRLAGVEPGVAVLRDRDPGVILETDRLPALVVTEAEEEPRDDFCGEDAFNLVLQIAVIAGGRDQAVARQTAQRLRARARAALAADPTLGGIARNLVFVEDPEAPLSTPAALGALHAATLALAVDYATAEGDPFRFA